MSTWTEDELRRIEGAAELQIAPVRRTGALRGRTPIWVVRAGDDLYVRAAGPSHDAAARAARGALMDAPAIRPRAPLVPREAR
jgi:hypothetical protein